MKLFHMQLYWIVFTHTEFKPEFMTIEKSEQVSGGYLTVFSLLQEHLVSFPLHEYNSNIHRCLK